MTGIVHRSRKEILHASVQLPALRYGYESRRTAWRKKGRYKNCGNELVVPPKNVEEDDSVSACLTDSFNTEEGNEERRAKAAANTRQLERESRIKVTTGDLSMPYEIIGPVYFSVSNKGLLFNQLRDLISKYRELLSEMTSSGTMTAATLD